MLGLMMTSLPAFTNRPIPPRAAIAARVIASGLAPRATAMYAWPLVGAGVARRAGVLVGSAFGTPVAVGGWPVIAVGCWPTTVGATVAGGSAGDDAAIDAGLGVSMGVGVAPQPAALRMARAAALRRKERLVHGMCFPSRDRHRSV